MKKEKGARKGTKDVGKDFNWSYVSFIFVMGVIFIGVFIFSPMVRGDKKQKEQKEQVVRDSLVKENATLRNILAAEMAANGDSMTIEERLKWSELEQYINQAYKIRLSEENDAYKWNDNQENEAYQKKMSAANEKYNQEIKKKKQSLGL